MGVRDLAGLAKIAAIVIEGGAGRSFLERAANAMGVAQSPASGKAPPAKRRAAR
jgi:hypothetical protein